jgi:HAD superfamily hydrolase (TIGR01490 family)
LAVFDLDGTLIHGDSFIPFFVHYARRRRRVGPLVTLPLYVSLYVGKLMSDRTAKQHLVRTFFGGEPLTAIAEHADWFCQAWLPRRLRAAAVERLREHQRQGHRVILLSASPDLYVPAIGKALGITEVVCTQVCVDGDCCAGRLAGANCKGAAKVELLRAYLGADRPPPESYGYADQHHDLPLLQWLTYGYLLDRSGGFRPVGRT